MTERSIFLRGLCIWCVLMSVSIEAHYLAVLQSAVQKFSDKYLQFSGIETERLLVRKLEMRDADDVFKLTSDPQMLEYTPMFKLMQTREEVEAYLDGIIRNYQLGMPENWAIVLKDAKRVVGIISIGPRTSLRAEIAYAVARDCWGKGIATEATKAVVDFGFKSFGLKRIEATCDPKNVASARVLEKSGMTYEGLLKSYICVRGKMCDRRLYAITEEMHELQK